MNGVGPNANRNARGDAGFTLVEALVSLFVFSLIATGCVAMLMQSVGSQRAVSESQSALRELQSARALLGADALQIAYRATREVDGARIPAFVGSASQGLAFVRGGTDVGGDGQGLGRLYAIRYFLDDGALVRRSRVDLDPAADAGAAVPDRIVFRSVRDGRFEYFDGANWRADWSVVDGVGGLPKAIAFVGVVPRYGDIRIEVLVEPAS